MLTILYDPTIFRRLPSIIKSSFIATADFVMLQQRQKWPVPKTQFAVQCTAVTLFIVRNLCSWIFHKASKKILFNLYLLN